MPCFYDDDRIGEDEETNNNDENFSSSNESEEEMDVDYPLLPENMLEHDQEIFDMRKFQNQCCSTLFWK